MNHDESPSPEDLARFGHQSAYCPKCGEEVWDDANYCGECGEYFKMAANDPPATRERKMRWRMFLLLIGAVAIILIFTIW